MTKQSLLKDGIDINNNTQSRGDLEKASSTFMRQQLDVGADGALLLDFKQIVN
ncbi:MAG: hypothetical protein ACLQT6_00420 [Desulfomonilaceae bacterium]